MQGSKIVAEFSDGSSEVIGGLGFKLEMYDHDGGQVDEEFVPNGGTLRLQTYLEHERERN